MSRVRGGRLLTTLFHITSSWPVQKKREFEAQEGTEEKYIITIIYFKIRPPKGHPTLLFYIIKGKGTEWKENENEF